jgi:hypothetical protein
VSKQITHRFHTERFSLKKLNEVEGKEQYHIKISNRFTTLEILDVNRACLLLLPLKWLKSHFGLTNEYSTDASL